MPRLLLMFVATGLFLVPVGCQKVELKEFSPDGNFKVLMPEKKEAKTESSAAGPIRMWTSEFNDGALLVAVIDAPSVAGDAMPEAIADMALKFGQKRAIEGVKGELISESAIKLADKHPGRQFEAKVKVPKKGGGGEVDGIIKCRMYFAGGKLYQLQAIGKPDWVNSEEIPKFLDSLQILN